MLIIKARNLGFKANQNIGVIVGYTMQDNYKRKGYILESLRIQSNKKKSCFKYII